LSRRGGISLRRQPVVRACGDWYTPRTLLIGGNAKSDPSLYDRDFYARGNAYAETGLPEVTFPASCPWTFNQIMADDFWPGDASH
jgi:hypothetical protein